jgi:nicotinate dehydrogenase subunit B
VSAATPNVISRRAALSGAGALIVSFTWHHRVRAADRPGPLNGGAERIPQQLPGSLQRAPLLDSWLRIDARSRIVAFTGKAELGQGITTALIQIVAEELAVDPASLTLVTADTARTPNEGYTAGSHSMQDSGTAMLNAAAQAREILIGIASKRLGVPREALRAANAEVLAQDGRRIAYGELVSSELLHVAAQPHSRLTSPARYRLIGTSFARVDIPAKLAGHAVYVQDLRLAHMVHARVVRPPSYGARLERAPPEEIMKLPGVLKVVRDGSFLAVVARREFQAVVAMNALARIAEWQERASLPEPGKLFAELAGSPAQTVHAVSREASAPQAVRTLDAEYRRAYQMHGSIGPSCAVALLDGGALTVWTHSQGVYPLRSALAELMQLPQSKVRCIQFQGSGCYGHNGADDAAADAALIARAVPGQPVRVQWMRADEHRWEPYGPAMLARLRGSLDRSGTIVAWASDLWSNTHSTRPGGAGSLLAAWYLAAPLEPPAPRPIPLPEGGGDRNAVPAYRVPDLRVDYHFVPRMPLRVSALRSLGAYLNVFAIESFIDELARAADLDPIAMRLRHLDDPRAVAVVRAAAEGFGWEQYRRSDGRGRGFAYARYKNLAAYLALALEAAVDGESGEVRVLRAVAAVDCGEAVNPDGVRNQIEGGILQALSWTLYEAVTFDRTRILSGDWSDYPILRFSRAPQSLEVRVLERKGEPFLGTGEAAQGPTAAAVANAIADATGLRMRDIPLTAAEVKAMMGASLR